MINYPESWRKTEKYLAYDHLTNSPGFLHQLAELNAVCLDAIRANRIPVLPRKLILSRPHNPFNSFLSSWDRYWDLEETIFILYRYYPFSKRALQQATYTVPILWVDNISNWIKEKPHKIISTEVLTNSNLTEYKLIYRKIPSSILWSQHFNDIQCGDLTYRMIQKNYQLIRYQYVEKAFFHRKPSSEVWAVVVDIVKQLGEDFWAIHIRRNDLLTNPYQPHSGYASNMSWIITNLKCAELNKNTAVFLMTDEQDSSYTLPLQEKFNIIRAEDFKIYKDLIAKYPDDNFLCFHVERLVYMHAKRRYKTATHFDGAFEFIPFPKPVYTKINYYPPHYPLPTGRKGRYFSYLSLERKNKLLNKWPTLLPLRYTFAQNMLQLRLGLGRRPKEDIEI